MAGTNNSSAPVKTAPSGQTKVAPVPGNSGNATSATGNTKIETGPTAHSNATSAKGKPKLDTAPESGANGAAARMPMSQTKSAGFAMGMRKAAAEIAEAAEFSAFDNALIDAEINPDIIAAVDVLAGHGVTVELPDGMKQKIAEIKEKFPKLTPSSGVDGK